MKRQDKSAISPKREAKQRVSNEGQKARVLTPRPRTPLVTGENVRSKAKQLGPARRSELPLCIGSTGVREARKILDEADTVAGVAKAKTNLGLAREKTTQLRRQARFASPLDRAPRKMVWRHLRVGLQLNGEDTASVVPEPAPVSEAPPDDEERCRHHPWNKDEGSAVGSSRQSRESSWQKQAKHEESAKGDLAHLGPYGPMIRLQLPRIRKHRSPERLEQ